MTEAQFAPDADRFYETAKWGLDQVEGILIPRIIQSSPDQELIDACMSFDDARSRPHVATVARSRGKIYNYFPNVQDLFTAASAVYGILCSRWATT
jgi:hypothetical protein